jgi:carbon monoxide dehydrogenase subunit G
MHRITVERTIAAPPERVFAAATDVHHFADIVPAIERVEVLTPGPMGVGTRFRETRKVFGRSATEEMRVVAFDPPRSYLVTAESHGCRYRTEFRFEPVAAGTRMTMDFGAEPLTLAAKVLSVLMKPMLKKMAELCAQDLDAIKAHVEGRP